ncbi:MAG TPA: hypothetical protein VJ725_30770 [Thermoanaerobaculia bacterium]|nr:hypothetical protein [Thermoanaerobaculia bacterium]
MADSVSSMLTIEIKGGPPKISAVHNTTVEAYERVQVNVPGADGSGTAVTLNLLPAGSKAKILAVTSSKYGEGLTYKGDGTAVTLDGPHLFTGGSIQLLGKIESLTVTNALGAGKDATVTILVGRDVVPPPAKADTKTQTATDAKAQTATDTKAQTDTNAQPAPDAQADSGKKKAG